MRRISIILAVFLAAGLFTSATAKDVKIGYIDSDRILEEYSEFQEARSKLQEEEQAYVNEATVLEDVVNSMRDELAAQSLMLSAESRAEKETRLAEKEQELNTFRRETWGEGGKLFTRNLELSRPILEKINAAIETISQQDGYDMVFDAASGNIVFALPQYDITQLVLDELEE
ncbi:OmpH family outer membrane protein [bacterium]|nr:OmpH family outer membrane protein [bacterium]RQV93408.1 MAG: OmpH family outer membrane protein [bacterium]